MGQYLPQPNLLNPGVWEDSGKEKGALYTVHSVHWAERKGQFRHTVVYHSQQDNLGGLKVAKLVQLAKLVFLYCIILRLWLYYIFCYPPEPSGEWWDINQLSTSPPPSSKGHSQRESSFQSCLTPFPLFHCEGITTVLGHLDLLNQPLGAIDPGLGRGQCSTPSTGSVPTALPAGTPGLEASLERGGVKNPQVGLRA